MAQAHALRPPQANHAAVPSPTLHSNTCHHTCHNLPHTRCLLLLRCLFSRANRSRVSPTTPPALPCPILVILHMCDLLPRAVSPTGISAPHSISGRRRPCRSCRPPAVLPHPCFFWWWPCRCCPQPRRYFLPTFHRGAGRPTAVNHLGSAPLPIYHLVPDVPLRHCGGAPPPFLRVLDVPLRPAIALMLTALFRIA